MQQILIVDNNEQGLYLLKTIFENKGFIVISAENGSEALEKTKPTPPSLIISDILMPVMDGFTLCKAWMRDPKLSQIPFILYTATYTDSTDEELGLSLGASRFLLKPQDPDVLIRIAEEEIQAAAAGRLRKPPRWTTQGENEANEYRLYSEALVRKLDAKVTELEATRRVLEHQIAERRQADAALRLHAKVFEQAHEGIMITDAKEHILSVNAAFCTLTGYSENELIGKSVQMLDSGRQETDFNTALRSDLNNDARWQGEVWIKNQSGEAQPVWLTVSALTDTGDRITHRISLLLDIGEKKMQAAQIEKLAFFDTNTGLPNRALLMDRLEQILAHAARRNSTVAVLFLNLSRFKEINETRGHSAGDRVLREVTQRFQNALHSDALLARFGGDEFVAVADHTDQIEAAFIAESLSLSLEKPVADGADFLHITARIGIAISPADGTSADVLIRHADTAMHRAKAAKRNHLFFRAEMSGQAARKIEIAGRLAVALAQNELELYFQPQFSLTGGALTGAEVLLRWNDAHLGPVSPGEFIPIAEERALINQLGDWVFLHTCKRAQAWREAGLRLPPRLSVNVSVYQLTDAETPNRFKRICHECGLQPEFIEIELTETAAMGDPEHSSQVLRLLKAAGFGIAIDDFGVGHSSLVYLKRFEADKLKIDMSFVRGMLQNLNDKAIVAAIINMARALGMRTIAEGVEEAAQAEALLSLGCDCVQGYHFGHPLPAASFAATWLQT